MANIIDILIIPDPERILRDHDPDTSPVKLRDDGQGYVFMAAPWLETVHKTGNLQQEEGGNELDIEIKVHDVLRWRMSSLSLGRNYQCFITNFAIKNGEGYISPPTKLLGPISVATWNPSTAPDAFNIIKQPSFDYCWQSVANAPGWFTYSTEFAIADDKGNNQGSFSFDPLIHIQ